jgi:hypothetical protein
MQIHQTAGTQQSCGQQLTNNRFGGLNHIGLFCPTVCWVVNNPAAIEKAICLQ